MTATFAPRPWPLPPGSQRGTPWLFARELANGQRSGGPHTLQWLLRRNFSIAPRRLGRLYLALCAVSAAIAGFLLLQGATVVVALAACELAVVGLALAVFARHAGDCETLTLVGRSLRVEQCFGSRVARADFGADWVTVEPAAGQGSLVQLSGRGQRVRVGRLLRPELRGAFAGELRQALRRAASNRGDVSGTDNESR